MSRNRQRRYHRKWQRYADHCAKFDIYDGRMNSLTKFTDGLYKSFERARRIKVFATREEYRTRKN